MREVEDFNKKYKFKLSRFNDFDKDAHIIDEEIERLFSTLPDKEFDTEITIRKKDIKGGIDLSSFRPQKELQPKVWVNGLINSRIRLRLLDISDDFFEFLGINWVKPSDVILTGSLANYNWSKYSDFDLHLLIDFKKVDERTDFVKEFFNSKKNEWNNTHDELKIYGFPVELYVQDVNEEHVASGVYSLYKNTWLKKPEKDNIKAIKLDKFFIKDKTLKYIKQITSLRDSINSVKDECEMRLLSKKVKHLFDVLKRNRKDSLEKRGEMGVYNIIYKVLRRMGYLDELLDLKAKTYDKLKSID